MRLKGKNILVCSTLLIICLMFTSCDQYNKNTYTNSQLSFQSYDHLECPNISAYSASYGVIPIDQQLEPVDCSKVKTALVINNTTKEPVIASHVHDHMYPASMTKLMTAILVDDAIIKGKLDMDQPIKLSHDIVLSDNEAARLCLYKGDTITVNTLLNTFLIRSLNDCGVVLAEAVAGSEEKFVKKMNDKAKAIGATNTHFVNCHGLHDDEHYTTGYDLYLIFQEFNKHENLHKIDQQSKYTVKYKNANDQIVTLDVNATNAYVNGNLSLPDGMKVNAWKTGTTRKAGSCLIMEVTNKQGDSYTVLAAGAKSSKDLYSTISEFLNYIK